MGTPSAHVISAIQKIRNKDIAGNRAVSEGTQSKISANINALIDLNFYDEDFVIPGYIDPNTTAAHFSGMIRVMFDSEILSYQFSMMRTGVSGSNIINAEVRNEVGAYLGDLFGPGVDRLLIPGNNRTGVLIGRDVEAGSNFANNIAAGIPAPQYGDLNFTQLNAGWSVWPFIEEAGDGGFTARLKLRMRGV